MIVCYWHGIIILLNHVQHRVQHAMQQRLKCSQIYKIQIKNHIMPTNLQNHERKE